MTAIATVDLDTLLHRQPDGYGCCRGGRRLENGGSNKNPRAGHCLAQGSRYASPRPAWAPRSTSKPTAMGKIVRCRECGKVYRELDELEDLRDNDSVCLVCNNTIEVADWDRVLASYEDDDGDVEEDDDWEEDDDEEEAEEAEGEDLGDEDFDDVDEEEDDDDDEDDDDEDEDEDEDEEPAEEE